MNTYRRTDKERDAELPIDPIMGLVACCGISVVVGVVLVVAVVAILVLVRWTLGSSAGQRKTG
jgi:hypothetical protein